MKPRRNDKLRVAWEGLGNTRTGRANTADRAPYMHTHHHHVRVHVCTVFVQWNIHTNPVHSSKHRVVTTHYGAGGYPQQQPKLRVAWQARDNTRPVRANTADRAACMLMTRGYVRRLVCTVCFQWNIHTNPVHSSVHRVVTTHYGAGGYLKETIKLRVAWQVMGNIRPVHTNTADRAPHTPVTHGYVRALVGTVCFEWNIQTNTVPSQ